MIESQPAKGHIGFLDGLRGLFATWVFAYHTAMFTGWFNTPIPPGGLAVDAFMLLSGLLMTHLFLIREDRQPLASSTTILEFYARRFFRIAPLYFVLLMVAMTFVTQYAGWLDEIWRATPPPWAANLHNDPSDRTNSLASLLAHVTFVFGLIPRFAANNVLPDWSLSLEMQFYAVFPFLLLATRRIGWTPVVIGAIIVQVVTNKMIGLYLTPTAFGLWPQPSMLGFKIAVFLVGALIAVFAHGRRDSEIVALLILATWACGGLVLKLIVATIIALAAAPKEYGHVRRVTTRILSLPICRWLGDVSYGVYLLHMMLLTPMCAMLNRVPAFLAQPAPMRFAFAFAIASTLLFPLAYALHLFIEKPGIEAGRKLLAKRRDRSSRVDEKRAA